MMKLYPEQLGEWVKLRECAQHDKSLAVFLAVRDDVQAALAAGYAVKTVWRNMQEAKRINFSYTAFLRYVNCMRRRTQAGLGTVSASPVPPLPGSAEQQSEPGRPPAKMSIKSAALARFALNPAPKNEELL
jgi:hypothetical protein